MANVTSLATQGTANGAAGSKSVPVLTHTVNVADAVTAGLLTTEQVIMINIPAGSIFKFYGLRNQTAITGVTRVDLGDAADDDLYVTNGATFTSGFVYTRTGESAIAATTLTEKLYTSADTIRLKLTGATLASAGAGTIGIVYSIVPVLVRTKATVDF